MSPSKQDDIAAVLEWWKTYKTNVNNHNLDAYWSHWTDDMIWMPPNRPTIYGKETCKEVSGFENYNYDLTGELQEVKVDKDIAFARFSGSEKIVPKDGSANIVTDRKCIWILQRQMDNSWKATHCIWNENTPVEAPRKIV